MSRTTIVRLFTFLIGTSFLFFIGMQRDASAGTIVNGGLELNAADNFKTVLMGNTYESWTSVGPGDVEFIREKVSASRAGPAFEGTGFVDLNGVGFTGAIQQTLSTLAGVTYEIEFALSGNPGLSGQKRGDKTMDVLWNGQVAGSFTFIHQASDTLQNLRWESHELNLTGLGNDVLTFASTTTIYNAAGPLLDAISVTSVVQPIPEPSSLALFSSLFGIAMIRSVWRRRRERA